MCAIDDCERSDIWLDEHVIAHKKWYCTECKRVIKIGERYVRSKSLYDGCWSLDQTCRHCWAASAWMREVCSGYIVGDLRYEMEEHWFDGYRHVAYARLIAGIKLQWHDGKDPVPTYVRTLAHRMCQAMVA